MEALAAGGFNQGECAAVRNLGRLAYRAFRHACYQFPYYAHGVLYLRGLELESCENIAFVEHPLSEGRATVNAVRMINSGIAGTAGCAGDRAGQVQRRYEILPYHACGFKTVNH